MEYKTRKELEEKYNLPRYQEKAKINELIREHELNRKDSLDYLLPEWITILKKCIKEAYRLDKRYK